MTWPKNRILAMAFLSLVAAFPACRASTSRYLPSAEAVGSGPAAQPATVYEVVPKGAEGAVQAKVWCDGVREDGFQMGLQIQNDLRRPVTFPSSAASLRFEDAETGVRPRETADLDVGPGSTVVILLHFPYPRHFEERPAESMAFSWQVNLPASVFKQTTAFAAEARHGFLPGPMRSGAEPLDRENLDRQRDTAPVGIPIGPDPSRAK